MDSNVNHLDLFTQAKLGNRDSAEVFARLIQQSLYAYIYRLTLNDNLAHDLTQEAVLEMLKSIEKLEFKHNDQLWSWLFKTAFSKIKMHFRAENRKKTVQFSAIDEETLNALSSKNYNDSLNEMVRKELA